MTKEEFKQQNTMASFDIFGSISYDNKLKILANQKHRETEKELFKIVGTYGLEDSNLINKPYEYQKSIRLKRYTQLKKFFEELTEEQINSNVFLIQKKNMKNSKNVTT